jgi:hypothetical protein
MHEVEDDNLKNSMWIINDDYHLPEDDNHHSHRRGNLKSYMDNKCLQILNINSSTQIFILNHLDTANI